VLKNIENIKYGLKLKLFNSIIRLVNDLSLISLINEFKIK